MNLPGWLTDWLTGLGLHLWTAWENKDIAWKGLMVQGRTCQWCGKADNRCDVPPRSF